MSGHVKIGGAWKTVSGVSTRVGGTWKTVQNGYTKIGGTWKEWYANLKDSYLAVPHTTSPYITTYAWSNGFGTKFANPGSLPEGDARGAAFNPISNTLAVAGGGAIPGNHLATYAFSASGFGTKYTSPNTDANLAYLKTAQFNSTGNQLILSSTGTYVVVGVNFTVGSGFGTVYTGPTKGETGDGFGAAINASSSAVAFYGGTSPYIFAYPWSPGFGTKYADPAVSPGYPPSTTFGTNWIKFHPTANVLMLAIGQSPYIAAYTFSGGFGTKFANPSTAASAEGGAVTFSKDGKNVFMAGTGTPAIHGYPWNNGFGSKYANPVTSISTGQGITVGNTNTTVAVTTYGTPYIHVYAFANGFGSKFSNPATLPTGRSFDASFG